jgi:DNA (cytosine-5)-methyltransferase 1
MSTLKVLDLFSGIGGFSLGLERTGGFETVAFCEVDKKCQRVLKKHWANVPIFDDVKTLKGDDLETIDVICGGFPCQDISLAGKGAGLAGERSGLWFEFHRLIKEIKPRWVIAENVAALRSRGLDQVLWSLSEIGYDAEWHCIPAAAVGAPHQRDRIWIVAYPKQQRSQGWLHRWAHEERQGELGYLGRCSTMDGQPIENQWSTEPNVGRVANGVSGRVDRLKQLGNAVVPQIPELIGRAILNV